jgi:RHS repeat-associated protein
MDGQTLQEAFVPLPGGATAVYNSSGLQYYRHADWLGSVRLVSTPSHTVSGDTAYAPFGEPYAQYGTPALSFTGQNADTASSLYDFPMREYGYQGRWESPDPLGVGAFNLANPQTLDRYAYVMNDPMALIDPLGLGPCPPGWVEYGSVNGDPNCGPYSGGGGAAGAGGTYWPQGALDQDVHGQVSGGFGGVTETWGYNSDLEPTSIVASSSAGTALSLSYAYAGNGSVTGVNNNASGQSGRNESITYDPLNRILTAQTAATSGQDCWGMYFGVQNSNLADDALGNLLQATPDKSGCPGQNLSLSQNGDNQITGLTYDGDGLRVEKSSGTLYWRAYTGQVLETTNTSGALIRDYIFFDGRRIAWKDSSGNVYYYFVDAIGSTRAVTTSAGSVCFSADYYPYGQEIDYTDSCSPAYKFTGYEYDSETGNYYAYARYYNPRLGRFLSADASTSDVGNPQTLNGYAYVVNDPTSSAGPLEFPAVYLSSSGAAGPGSAASIVAATMQGLPESVAAFAPPMQSGATPRSVPAHPLQEWLRIARHDEAEVRAFLTYLRTHAPSPSNPYGSAFGAICAAFPGGGQYAPSWVGEPGCGNYLRLASSVTLPQNWQSMTPTEQGLWFYLNYYQAGFEAIFGAPSASGNNTVEGLSLYTHAYGFPAEDDIPIGGNLMGDWLDPGFPQFDMQMFFGSGGGGGGSSCLPTPWDMDPCSF